MGPKRKGTKHCKRKERDDSSREQIDERVSKSQLKEMTEGIEATRSIFLNETQQPCINLSNWWSENCHENLAKFPPEVVVREIESASGSLDFVATFRVSPYQSALRVQEQLDEDASCAYLNVAGPVWSLAFAPMCYQDSAGSNERVSSSCFLAVATSRAGWLQYQEGRDAGIFRHGVGSDVMHEIENPQLPSANILQMWKMRRDKSSIQSIDLHCAIDFSSPNKNERVQADESGPHWKVVWYDNPLLLNQICTSTSYVGILAVLCGSGKCYIVLVPEKVSEVESSGLEAPVLFSSSLRTIELKAREGDRSKDVERLTSVAWQQTDHNNESPQCIRIGCGSSHGVIYVWDIPLSYLLPPSDGDEHFSGICSPPPTLCFRDLSRKQSSSAFSTVCCLAFCPYNKHLILSGGYDSSIKIWHDSCRFQPKYVRHSPSWIYTCNWDPSGGGIYWSDASTNTLHYDCLWASSFLSSSGTSVHKMYSHANSMGGIWNMDISSIRDIKNSESDREDSMLMSVSSDGSVVISSRQESFQRLTETHSPENIHFRILSVTNSDDDTCKTGTLEDNDKCKIVVDIKPQLPPSEGNSHDGSTLVPPHSSVASPAVALHSIHCFEWKGSSSSRVVAFGGAAGLIRVGLELCPVVDDDK